VGQGAVEEVDHAPAVDGHEAGKGDNFGWPQFEGSRQIGNAPPANATAPVFEYLHSPAGECSITGGFVYHGKSIPGLDGAYIYTDYCLGDLHALVPNANGGMTERKLGDSAVQVSSFGQGNTGEVYVLSQQDGLFRLDRA
jgi:hypothetical protein